MNDPVGLPGKSRGGGGISREVEEQRGAVTAQLVQEKRPPGISQRLLRIADDRSRGDQVRSGGRELPDDAFTRCSVTEEVTDSLVVWDTRDTVEGRPLEVPVSEHDLPLRASPARSEGESEVPAPSVGAGRLVDEQGNHLARVAGGGLETIGHLRNVPRDLVHLGASAGDHSSELPSLRISPEILEPVEIPRRAPEYMHHHVDIVDEDPLAAPEPLDVVRSHAIVPEFVQNVVGDCPDVDIGGAGG